MLSKGAVRPACLCDVRDSPVVRKESRTLFFAMVLWSNRCPKIENGIEHFNNSFWLGDSVAYTSPFFLTPTTLALAVSPIVALMFALQRCCEAVDPSERE